MSSSSPRALTCERTLSQPKNRGMDYVVLTRKHRGTLVGGLGGLLGQRCPYDGTTFTETVPIGANGQVQVPTTLCAYCLAESPVTGWERQDMDYDENLRLRKKPSTTPPRGN